MRKLVSKVNANFLSQTKATIQMELTRQPLVITYDQALANFQNEVNRKFPPELVHNWVQKNINEVKSGQGRGGRGGGSCGSNAPKGYNRSSVALSKRTRNNSKMITLMDGTVIEVHPSFNFGPAVWNKIKEQDKQDLQDAREAYKKGQRIQQVEIQTSAGATQVSQLTEYTTMMGGRNEQASIKGNQS